MSSIGGDLTGLLGLAIVGTVAVKTVEAIGDTVNKNQPKKKKKSNKNNNIFDMGNQGNNNIYGGNFGGNKSRKSRKKSNADNIFSTGFGF